MHNELVNLSKRKCIDTTENALSIAITGGLMAHSVSASPSNIICRAERPRSSLGLT